MSASQSRKKPITAGELLGRLEKDPEYIAREQEWEMRRQQAVIEYREAAAPVLADLAEAGFPVGSVGELFNKKLNYKQAIPILLRWLPQVEDLRVKDDIVRALSVKWARPLAAPVLVQMYRQAPAGGSFKWAIGNALSVVADDSVFDGVVELVRDKQHGKDREMLAVALGNMRDPRAADVLLDLLADEEVAGHALIALGKLKAKKARPLIEQFLKHPKAWVRQAAKRALAKIDKAG